MAPLTPMQAPPVGPLIDHVVNAATYPWVAAIVTALAAFVGTLVAQLYQSRRERSQWTRQQDHYRFVRQEERERDRISWMREDQQRFASDSRKVYQRFLNAAHELDFHIKRIEPNSSNLDHAAKANDALTELLKARAEVELFGTDDVYRATGRVAVELLKAFKEAIHRSDIEAAKQRLDAAQQARSRLVTEMRRTLYKEITLPGEVTPSAPSVSS